MIPEIVIHARLKLGLHVRLIVYDSIQTCSPISHCLEIYNVTKSEYKKIGQTNRIVLTQL